MSTEEELDLPDLTELGAGANGARGRSLIQTADKARKSREKSLFLDIPSWDGALIGEYRVIDKNVLDRLTERQLRRVRSGGKIDATLNDIELILTACVGLWARDPESGDRVAIEDDGGIVGFDRIATVLGKEDSIKSAADAVRYLTAEVRNDDGTWQENSIAIGMHSNTISRYMRDPSKRNVDLDSILGEL